MIERITINRHDRDRYAFAGVMQAAGLVERQSIAVALKTTKPSGAFASEGFFILVAGARNHLNLLFRTAA